MINFLIKLLNDGGPLVYVILLLLLIALLIVTDRFVYLHRCRVDTFELLRGLMTQLRNGNVKEAIVNCDERTGPVGEIFRAAIEHWSEGERGIRYAVEDTMRLLLPRLERNMRVLKAIASITPILGMLGTLCAMIAVFGTLSQHNGQFVGVMPLMGNISQALICTATGLVVALVCQLLHAVLVEKEEKLLNEMGKGASEITYFLATNPAPEAAAAMVARRSTATGLAAPGNGEADEE